MSLLPIYKRETDASKVAGIGSKATCLAAEIINEPLLEATWTVTSCCHICAVDPHILSGERGPRLKLPQVSCRTELFRSNVSHHITWDILEKRGSSKGALESKGVCSGCQNGKSRGSGRDNKSYRVQELPCSLALQRSHDDRRLVPLLPLYAYGI